MYFSNIANEELKHFHGIIGADFSMSLTDILTSNLFKVETIIADSIYRIYPLFYCRKVISSNTNDKILDTRCLILQKTENETYLSFITNSPRDNIILNEHIINIKDIEDSLTTDEFNALVYRLRQRGNLTGTLNFEENNSIAGVYATYEFNNIGGQLRNDKGIIVNNKVKNNPLTVKLINPFFLNAKYVLTFTVRSITGANVCEEGKDDFITKDTFSITLVEGSDIAIPLENYVNDSVLDFEVNVSISFDVPEIVNSNFNLNLLSNKSVITVGESISLTANLAGDDNVAGYLVQFFEDNRLIGTETTNNEGKAVLNYTPENASNHLYSATVLGMTRSLDVLVNKLTTNLTITVSKNSIVYGESVNLTGTLLVNNQAVGGLGVKLYNNNILIKDLTTDSNGNIVCNLNNLSRGDNNLRLEYVGDNNHEGCNANVSVIAKRPTTVFIERNTSPPVYAVETVYEVEGYLYDDENNKLSNKTLVCKYNGSSRSFNLTTDENGRFRDHRILSANDNKLTINFAGDDYYVASSKVHQFTVIRHTPEFRDVIIKANTISGYLVQSETNKPIIRARVEVLYNDNYVHGCTTNNEGYFINSQVNGGQNYSPRIWNSLDYDGDPYNNALHLDLTTIAVIRTSKIIDVSQNDPNGENFVHIGRLVDDLGNPIANATVNITLDYNNYKFTRTTDENGSFTVNTAMDTSIICEYVGDNGIEGCTAFIY